MRRKTRSVRIGDVIIGGDADISVQSMTCTDTRDVSATVGQIKRLEEAGCEIIRVAVPDMEAARALRGIKRRIKIPLIADIHFNPELALEAIEEGVDGLRLNPGNITDKSKISEIVLAAKEIGIPIRVGVNAGSLDKRLIEKHRGVTAEGMVESALWEIKILEELGFHDIIVALKASDIGLTIEANRLLASQVDYPFHIGITEAGTSWSGTIRSAVGIGSLLLAGIGDTLRVSLTADPVEEVRVGFEILKSLGLRERGATLISCPTCGRCEIDLFKIAQQVEMRLANIKKPIKIAIMGCVVNGPGEAKEADVGIAGGRGSGALFRKGKVIRKVKEEDLVEALLTEVESLLTH